MKQLAGAGILQLAAFERSDPPVGDSGAAAPGDALARGVRPDVALLQRAQAGESSRSAVQTTHLPDDPDWRVRYAALEKIGPRPEAIPVFVQALQDPRSSIRRLAVVYLGLTRDSAAVPPLCKALEDETALTCEYVGHIPTAKGFGTFPMYVLKPRTG
jgi:HEAT repeat protein